VEPLGIRAWHPRPSGGQGRNAFETSEIFALSRGRGSSESVTTWVSVRAIALASFAVAAAASSAAVGCARLASEAAQVAGLEGEPSADTERKVCPSARNPDGSWVVVDGVDTSDYQFTDWNLVVARNPKIKYAFSRVSAGLVRVDTRFHFDWPAIKRVGLVRGAYQYFKPSQSAVAQADLFLQRLREEGGLEAGDFPPVVDVETTNDMPLRTVVCRVKIWLARVERETGRKPLIYSSSTFNDILPSEYGRFPLWVANYVATPSVTCPRMPDAWNKWAFWQYSETTTTVGIYRNGSRDDLDGGSIELQDGGDGGPVESMSDVNYFDGTITDLNRFVTSSVSTEAPPDPPPLSDPPHVPGASPDAGGPVDCADGCCVAGPS
jgi:lysozyme